MKKNYLKLCAIQEKIHNLNHARSILNWDQATTMSIHGNNARSQSLAEISSLIHELITKKETKKLILSSQTEDLNELELANLREIKNEWLMTHLLPKKLIMTKRLAQLKCEFEWRVQRKYNDWKGFLKNFKHVVNHSREEAKILSDSLGISPYDALIQRYDPGLKSEEIDILFLQVKDWLPRLTSQICEKQKNTKSIRIKKDLDTKKQKKLCTEIIKLLGFNFNKGRLDESIHPFCGGVKEDIRITTRFSKNTFLHSLFAAIHETGHARYEQNLPSVLYNQPVSKARSMSIHESQSLFFEKQIGCNPNFIKRILPIIKRYLNYDPEFNEFDFLALINTVEPSYIRVDADEVTYPAHIIVRYEIEKNLINGDSEPEDIPSLWDEKMTKYLGISTKGNYKDGVLQDIHWPGGQFGYFPCYTLGAIYAAQWFHFASKEIKNIDQVILSGNLEIIFEWLNKNIWSNGSKFETADLTKKACKGETLNVKYFKNHLENRYLI